MNEGILLIFGNNRRGSKGLRRQRGKDGILWVGNGSVSCVVAACCASLRAIKNRRLPESGVVKGFVATGSCISRVKQDNSGRFRQFDMGIESRQRLFQYRRLGVVPYPQNAPDFLWCGIQ